MKSPNLESGTWKPELETKTFFIDIGQVLVGLDYPSLLKHIQSLSPLSLEQISQHLTTNPDIWSYEAGQLSTEAFLGRLSRTLKINTSSQALKEAWGSLFPPGSLISSPLFDELGKKYQLVALSNTNEMHFDYLRRTHPLVNKFDDYVLSYQVGSLKPDPRIFKAALSKVGRSPKEVIFIDDRIENIRAAEKLGIRGILFVEERQLKQRLRNLGLLAAAIPFR